MNLSAHAAGRGAEALGLAWALGMALYTVLSFVLYLAGIPGGVAVAAALAATLPVIAVIVRRVWVSRGMAAHTDDGAGAAIPLAAVIALVLAGWQVAAAALRAARTPFAAWDAWSFWVLKAHMFVVGGPRPGYFRDPLTLHTHPDYPLNLPLAMALFFRLPGSLGVTLAALVGPACLLALLLLLYGGLARLYGCVTAALAVCALSFVPALTAQTSGGDADVPLALYLGGATLYLLAWWRLRCIGDALLMGLLAGGAVWTKKEGLPVAALLLTAYLVGEIARATRVHGERRDGQGQLSHPLGPPVVSRDAGAGAGGAGGQRGCGDRGRPAAPASAAGPRGYDAGPRVKIASAPWRLLQVLGAALAFSLPWLLFARVVHPLARDFLPLTLAVFAAHAGRLPHILALVLLQTLDFANWSLLWVVMAGALLLAARRFTLPSYGLALLLLGQMSVYALSFVFSDWQPYTAHMQTSLDRLLVQAAPLALLLLVECVQAAGVTRARVIMPADAVERSAA